MPRCLSFHAAYRCGRTGVCCSSNWPIPVEADRLARLRAAIATGALRAPVGENGSGWLARPAPARGEEGEIPAVLASRAGRCVFLDSQQEHRCRIQSVLGHDALPLACRQFPRVCVLDARGVSVVLSNYCPTAAALLSTAGPVSIVDSPLAFPDSGEYVGLDARTGWPPILRPGVLMDWPSWWEFERRAVDFIANIATSAEAAMAGIREATERTRSWSPDDGPLLHRVRTAFDQISCGICGTYSMTPAARARCVAEIDAAIPPELRPVAAARSARPESQRWIRRFLASHAFANWDVHLGEDLRAWFTAIERAFALVTLGLDAREADLRLRHLASPTHLAARRSG